MTRFALWGAGVAAAHVAATRRRTSQGTGTSRIISGFSVKRHVLGQKVYNDHGEVVGQIDDLILVKAVVSHAVLGVGGFLGLGTHDVVIPVGKFTRENKRIVLPGASREAIRAMPRFEYKQMAVGS
jgi:hypothetical protein